MKADRIAGLIFWVALVALTLSLIVPWLADAADKLAEAGNVL